MDGRNSNDYGHDNRANGHDREEAWSETDDFRDSGDNTETTMMNPVTGDELAAHEEYDDPYGNRRFDPEESRITDPDELNSKLDEAEKDRDDALFELDEAKERNEALQEEHQREQEEWEIKENDWEEEREKAKKYMIVMGVVIALISLGLIFLGYQNVSLNNEREAAMEQGRALSQEEAGIRISELERERDELIGQRDDANSERDSLRGEVESANAERDRARGELDAERRNSGGTADTLREKDTAINDLTRQNESLQRDLESHKEQLRDARNQPRETATETATTTVTTTVQPETATN